MVPLYETLRWRRVAAVRTFVAVLRPGAMAASRRGWNWLRGMDGLASGMYGTVSRWGMGGRRGREEETAPAGMEEFCANLAGLGGVRPSRSRELFEWKFGKGPMRRAMAWSVRGPEGRLKAMVAAKIFSRDGLRWMEVADVAALEPTAGRAVIGAAVSAAVRAGMDLVRVRVSSPAQAGGLPRPLWWEHTRPLVDEAVVWSRDGGHARALEGPWALTALVSDAVDYGGDEIGQERKEPQAALC
jgi:hypothetical protein